MRTYFHIVLAAAAFVVVLGHGTPAAADDGEAISVGIRSIAASKSGEGVDEKLGDLESKLEKAFGEYSTFEQLTRVSFTVDKGQTKSVTLPEGSEISITFHGPADDLLKVGVGIPSLDMNASLRVSSGSTFFQAGLDYEDGILIVAITVDEE